MSTRRWSAFAFAVLFGAACAGGSDQVQPLVATPREAKPAATPTPPSQPSSQPEAIATLEPTPVTPATAFEIVSFLASDELMGRDSQTEESAFAQEFLVAQLAMLSEPIAPDEGQAGYRVAFGQGTNLIGIIPGTDLAEEYVLIGAHYDHVGNNCRRISSEDAICNGAADNAAGVAVAINVARGLADQPTRRSIIIALWDSEEDGLLGSKHYVADPPIPLEQTVSYINFDIQGANLSPALSRSTFVIGAETGGQPLIDSIQAATAPSPLDIVSFNLLFGQGRSDHAPFAAAGVPVAFFTDTTNGCYHSVDDELDALDFTKLDLQIDNATRLAVDLANTDIRPRFNEDAALTTFDDAVNLLQLLEAGKSDFALLGAAGEAESAELLAALIGVVQAGPDAYEGNAANIVLGGAALLVERLANGFCLPVSK